MIYRDFARPLVKDKSFKSEAEKKSLSQNGAMSCKQLSAAYYSLIDVLCI